MLYILTVFDYKDISASRAYINFSMLIASILCRLFPTFYCSL